MPRFWCFSRQSARRSLTLLAAAGTLAGLGGCEVDSYLDPSVIGRWETTPTEVPVVSYLAPIEQGEGDAVDYSDPTESDLVPVPSMYRLGPGDRVRITMYDVIEVGKPELYERQIDVRGTVELPQFGQVYVAGQTVEQAQASIAAVVRRLVPDPVVSIETIAQRNQTFTILGAVQTPGPYFIPDADYRLMEALTSGGAFNQEVPYVYIIRQVRVSDEARGLGVQDPAQGTVSPAPAADPNKLIDLIDDLSKPKEPGGSPGLLAAQPGQGNPPPAIIDLESDRAKAPEPQTPPTGESGWVYLNGQWIQVQRGGDARGGTPTAGGELVAQRVIRVPLKPLLNGERKYNIVVRPGDIVRVPSPTTGYIYVWGQVARPGPYQIPDTGKYTFIRSLVSAGGLGTFAIPERIDITRMVGDNRQATIRVDGRAIVEGTQPDIVLKPDDVINVGTNFWATPLAVFRNGFRASYGFGFIVDRNFAEEVFGLQDSQRIRGTTTP